jgi:hypothetical protein
MSNLDDALKRLGDIEQLLVDYYLKQDAAYWLASVEKLRIFILSQSIEDDAKADLISHLLSAMNLPAAAIDRIHQEYTEYKGHRLSRTGRVAIKKHSTPRDAIVAKYIKASPRDTDHGIATAIFNKLALASSPDPEAAAAEERAKTRAQVAQHRKQAARHTVCRTEPTAAPEPEPTVAPEPEQVSPETTGTVAQPKSGAPPRSAEEIKAERDADVERLAADPRPWWYETPPRAPTVFKKKGKAARKDDHDVIEQVKELISSMSASQRREIREWMEQTYDTAESRSQACRPHCRLLRLPKLRMDAADV